MPTTHFRSGRNTVVLAEEPETQVGAVIAELAEVLVSTQLATQEEVAALRLAIEIVPEAAGDGPDSAATAIAGPASAWREITDESSATLAELGVTDRTVVGFAFGSDAEFVYDNYVEL